MITWSVRIIAWIAFIFLIMSAHWIWAIIAFLFAIGFHFRINGEIS